MTTTSSSSAVAYKAMFVVELTRAKPEWSALAVAATTAALAGGGGGGSGDATFAGPEVRYGFVRPALHTPSPTLYPARPHPAYRM